MGLTLDPKSALDKEATIKPRSLKQGFFIRNVGKEAMQIGINQTNSETPDPVD